MAGEPWQEHGLVFASRVGTPLSANNVIRAFRVITKKAGSARTGCPGRSGTPLRRSSSANGVPGEIIARDQRSWLGRPG